MAALQAQLEYETNLKDCDYAAAEAQTTPTFSASLIELGCTNQQVCCVANMDFDELASRYTCGDRILYYDPRAENAKVLTNGTVVISRWETIINAANSLQITEYRFHWNPVGMGQYRLDYVDGNDFSCPTFAQSLFMCSQCQV